MIVKCEKCQTKFKIPDEKVTEKGVKVRCTKCQTVFRVKKSEGPGATDSSTPPPKSTPPPLPHGEVGNPFNSPTRPGPSIGLSNQPTRVATGPGQVDRMLAEDLAAQPSGSDFVAVEQTREVSQQLGLDPLQFLNELSSEPPQTPAPALPSPNAADDPFADLMSSSSGTAAEGSALGDQLFADSTTPPPLGTRPEPDTTEVSFGPGTLEEPPTGDRRSRLGRGYTPIARPARVQTAERNIPIGSNKVALWSVNILLSSLLACLLFLFGATSANEGRLDFAAFLTSPSPAGSQSDLSVEDVNSGQYETRSGSFIFFVRGDVQNRGRKPGRARVRVEIIDGSQVVQSADAIAGAAAGPEDLYGLSDRKDLAEIAARLAKQADEIAPGGRTPFTAIFYDFPPDLTGMRLKFSVQSLGPNETARR